MIVKAVFWILLLLEVFSHVVLVRFVRLNSSPYLNWINAFTNSHIFGIIVSGYVCSVFALCPYVLLKKMKRPGKAQPAFYSFATIGALLRFIGAVQAVLLLLSARRISLPKYHWMSMFIPFALAGFLSVLQMIWHLAGVVLVRFWWKKYFAGKQGGIMDRLYPWSSVVLLEGIEEDNPVYTRNSYCEQYSLGLQYILSYGILWSIALIKKHEKNRVRSAILTVVLICQCFILRVLTIGDRGIVYLSPADLRRLSRINHEPAECIDRRIRLRVQVLNAQQTEQTAAIWDDAVRQNRIHADSVVHYLIPEDAYFPATVPGVEDFSIDGRIHRLELPFHSSLPVILNSERSRFYAHNADEKEDDRYSRHYADPAEILRIIGDQQLLETYYRLSSGDKCLFEFLHNAMLCDNHLTSFRMCLNFCEMLLCCVWLNVGLRQGSPMEQILDDNIITIRNSLADALDASGGYWELNRRLKKKYPIFRNAAIGYYLNSIDAADVDMNSSYDFCQIAELLHYIRVRVHHSNAYTPNNRCAAWSAVATLAFILCEILNFEHFVIRLEERGAYIGYENDLIPAVKDGIDLIRNNMGHPEFARMHRGRIQYFDFYAGDYVIPEIKN